jgi:hypothetical protein
MMNLRALLVASVVAFACVAAPAGAVNTGNFPEDINCGTQGAAACGGISDILHVVTPTGAPTDLVAFGNFEILPNGGNNFYFIPPHFLPVTIPVGGTLPPLTVVLESGTNGTSDVFGIFEIGQIPIEGGGFNKLYALGFMSDVDPLSLLSAPLATYMSVQEQPGGNPAGYILEPGAMTLSVQYPLAAYLPYLPTGTQGYFVTDAIPEPETYAMLLAGLGLLGFMARRRKQNVAAA